MLEYMKLEKRKKNVLLRYIDSFVTTNNNVKFLEELLIELFGHKGLRFMKRLEKLVSSKQN